MAGEMQGVMSGAAMGSKFGPWGAVAGGVLGASGLFGGGGGDEAAKQAEANRQAQLEWNRQQDPFSAGGNRAQYVPRLNDLMNGGYAGVQNDPMYQWQQQQGMNNLQRGMSARGMGNSGAEMLALNKQGFGLAGDFFNQQYNRLADLSGASRGGGAAAMGQNPQNVYNQSMDQQQSSMNAFGGMLGGLKDLFGDTNPSGGGGSIDGISGGSGNYSAGPT